MTLRLKTKTTKALKFLRNNFYSIIIAHLLLLSFSNKAWSQNATFQTILSLPEKTYSLYELAQTIQSQADVSFSYNSKKVRSSTTIALPKPQTDLGSLLYMLNKDYGIVSRVQGTHIIFVTGPTKEHNVILKEKRKNIADRKKASLKEQKRAAKEQLKKRNQNKPETEIAVSKESANSETENSDKVAYQHFLEEVVKDDDVLKQHYLDVGNDEKTVGKLTSIREARNLSDRTNGIIANLSVHADENFYLNPQLEIGYKYFYATAAYSFNGAANHFRYGAGLNYPVSQKVSVGMFVNYGKFEMSDGYFQQQITPAPDSGGIADTVTYSGDYQSNSSLLKIGFRFDYHINPHISISIAPVFNSLSTTLNQNGLPVSVNDLFPTSIFPVPASDFNQLANSPLVLSDNFTFDKSNYNKSWLGVQIGLRIWLFRKPDP